MRLKSIRYYKDEIRFCEGQIECHRAEIKLFNEKHPDVYCPNEGILDIWQKRLDSLRPLLVEAEQRQQRRKENLNDRANRGL
jgi:hypothetical protein